MDSSVRPESYPRLRWRFGFVRVRLWVRSACDLAGLGPSIIGRLCGVIILGAVLCGGALIFSFCFDVSSAIGVIVSMVLFLLVFSSGSLLVLVGGDSDLSASQKQLAEKLPEAKAAWETYKQGLRAERAAECERLRKIEAERAVERERLRKAEAERATEREKLRVIEAERERQDDLRATQYVTVDKNGDIHINVQNAVEASLAIKKLRLLKKAWAVRKREVTSQQKAIRADYTDNVRRRGSKFVGGGGLGRFIRLMQTGSRDSARAGLARALEPLERKMHEIEAASIAIDRAIGQMEVYVLRGG